MQKAYSTEYSQAVTHPSTNSALCCLTAVIGRELVLSTWYGRRCITNALIRVKLNVDSIEEEEESRSVVSIELVGRRAFISSAESKQTHLTEKSLKPSDPF